MINLNNFKITLDNSILNTFIIGIAMQTISHGFIYNKQCPIMPKYDWEPPNHILLRRWAAI